MFSTPSDRHPIIISGPSGVGKGTLCQKLVDKYPEVFGFTVSHTTRDPRPGETDGNNYYFTPKDIFASLIAEGAFLEHTTFNGQLYGTSRQTVDDVVSRSLIPLLDIEMEGVEQIRSRGDFDARYVFIKPPSLEALEVRLRGRGTETEDAVQRRLNRARIELKWAESAGIHGAVIVNGELNEAFAQLEQFAFSSK